MNTPSYLRLQHPLTWSEVFEIWRANEADMPEWQEHSARHGFDSWEAWRKATHAALHGNALAWSLYEIDQPVTYVPLFRGGTFTSWERRFYPLTPLPPRFAYLATRPGIQDHPKVLGLLDNFPTVTTLTGLHMNKEIFIIEGMHRACALALASRLVIPLKTIVRIALAEWAGPELPKLGLKK